MLRALFLVFACAACAPKWTPIVTTYADIVLSADGDGKDTFYIVGGDLGGGRGGMVQRFADGKWTRISTGSVDTLWWVGHAGTSRWAVGEAGTVLRIDGTAATRMTVPSMRTLFGVWGASPDDVWVVGGMPQGGPGNDVVLRFDGSAWRSVDLPVKKDIALLKVWGAAADDVWICGQLGTLWHWNGSAFEEQMLGTRANIVTVAGRARDDVWAVGGPPLAFFHFDGTAWSPVEGPSTTSGLAGIAFGKNGEGVAVGLAGTKWHQRAKGAQWTDASEGPPVSDLHATYVADDGRALAGGGNYLALDPTSQRRGVLATWAFTLPAPDP